jgi:putative ABC transport system ATP-binding protein
VLVAAERLGRTYAAGGAPVPALADVTVAIPAGQFAVAMGPSGSGKSTFLNLVGCLDRPTSGVCRIAGEDTARLSPDALAALRARRIGFVFQSFHLLPRLDALANVELPLIYRGVPRRTRRELAAEALDRVGLAARAHHRPNELSGGQQQRVAIARAIVGGPDLLLADEPTGALDSRTGREIIALFQALNRDGMAVLMVTHDPGVARHAQRVLHFHDGHLVGDAMQAPADAAAELAA